MIKLSNTARKILYRAAAPGGFEMRSSISWLTWFLPVIQKNAIIELRLNDLAYSFFDDNGEEFTEVLHPTWDGREWLVADEIGPMK